jgi:GAF domain-containing protein
VIFCTAHFGDGEARDLAKQCGVDQVLTKPGELGAILRAVDECLGHSAPITSAWVPENFSLEHVRFLTNKLSAQSDEFKAVNFRLEALIEIASQLASEPLYDSLLERFCHSARALMNARYAIVGTAPENDHALDHLCVSGVDLEAYAALKNPHADSHAVARLTQRGEPVRMRNPGGHPEVLGFPNGFPPFDSLLAAPIVSLHRSYGWLCLLHRLDAIEFSAEDEWLAGILGALVGRIYENGKMYSVIKQSTTALEQQIAEHKRDKLMKPNSELRIASPDHSRNQARQISPTN